MKEIRMSGKASLKLGGLCIDVLFDAKTDEHLVFVEEKLFAKIQGNYIPFTYLEQMFGQGEKIVYNEKEGKDIQRYCNAVKQERIALGLNKKEWLSLSYFVHKA